MSAVHERVGMPLDEFIRISNDNPFEIINGERYPKVPTVGGHNYTVRLIFRCLSEQSQAGECFFEATYVLPNRYDSNWVTGSRTPDVMFISAERWNAYIEANPNWRDIPYLLVPDLVVEVISPTDKFTEVNIKVNAYLEDGVQIIVLVDPKLRTAIVHAPSAQPLHLGGEATLDLSNVISGFTVALSTLFA
jgi:Uma2 family endonuclease